MKSRSMLAGCLVLAPLGAQAAIVAFSASDPVGVHMPGTIDVTGLNVVADILSGAHGATLFADAASPFVGRFNVEVVSALSSLPIFSFSFAV